MHTFLLLLELQATIDGTRWGVCAWERFWRLGPRFGGRLTVCAHFLSLLGLQATVDGMRMGMMGPVGGMRMGMVGPPGMAGCQALSTSHKHAPQIQHT